MLDRSRKMDIVNILLFLSLLLSIILSFNVFFISLKKDYLEQHFVYLAKSFISGRFDSEAIPYKNDIIPYNGKNYIYFGPMPALLAIPAVKIFGDDFKQQWLSFIFTIINFYLIYKLTFKLGIKKKTDCLWLAFFYIFSSVYFYVSLATFSSYLQHVIGTTFLFLAILEYFSQKRWWLIGLLVGLAVSTRITLFLALFFFIYDIIYNGDDLLKIKLKNFVTLMTPIIICGLMLAIYNFLRFNSIFETGYLINHIKFIGGPIFDLRYIPVNLYYFLISPPHLLFAPESRFLTFPYLTTDLNGVSIFFTSPVIIYLFIKKNYNKIALYCWYTILIILGLLLIYGWTGYSQIGYRYALDFQPFLLILLIFILKPILAIKAKILILIGFLVNYLMILNTLP